MVLAMVVLFVFASPLYAAGEEVPHLDAATVFLGILIILLAAKLSSIVERFGQPLVLGELAVGVILGNLVLFGIDVFEPLKTNVILTFLSELGVVILLFQVGLETHLQDMRRVGARAFAVACVGVAVPFALGTWFAGPPLLPGQSFGFYLFLGATLAATSVGITARVFRDLGKLHTPEAQIVLGAAVIDDVLGLIILAVVSAIVTVGAVSAETVAWITFKAAAFLAVAILLGQLVVRPMNHLFSKIHTGTGMKFTLAIGFGLAMAYLAQQVGLSPIVGAFAAGLVLEPIHFSDFDSPKFVAHVRACLKDADPQTRTQVLEVIDEHAHRHVEDLVEPLGIFLVPIFFVLTGMGVKLSSFLDLPILLLALALTVVAFVGKIASGIVAGKVNKWIVGWGMIPRGEVGLIFAATGKTLGIMSDEIFSALVIVIILTTLLTPPFLTWLIKRQGMPPGVPKERPIAALSQHP